MADLDTMYTLADIKDYFRGCRDSATGCARKRFEKYIGAVDDIMQPIMNGELGYITHCIDCRHWEGPDGPPEEESTSGHCRYDYGPCQNQTTDAFWSCADGERRDDDA